MKRCSTLVAIVVSLSLLLIGIPSGKVLADGTETLGPPSIAIASGSGIVAAGTGLDTQPGTINVNVPVGAAVNQVLLYWSGATVGNSPGDNTIEIDGIEVTGTLIGGPAFFFSSGGDIYHSSYRADITGLGLVSPGANMLAVSGLNFGFEDSGAGVLVIFDDGSADIQIRDGLDLAFFNFPEPRQTTVPQTFSFVPSSSDRVADLVIFATSVGGSDRPNSIVITVDGISTTLVDPLGSFDGDLWDTLDVPIIIPSGASQVTVEVVSTPSFDPLGASLSWIGVGLAVVPEEDGDGEGCTPGYWKNHLDAWPPTGYAPGDDFDTTFGVDLFDPDITLDDAVNAKGGKVNRLARHGTAALLSAAHPDVDYSLSVAEVIAA
jgi:hypothetical protein